MSPEVEAQMRAIKERRQKNYAKTLGFKNHIPDPFDDDLPPSGKTSKGGEKS